MKVLSIFLALINSLAAGLLILFNVSSAELHSTELMQTLIQNTAFMTVIAFSIATWLACMRDSNSGAALLGGIVLVVMGAVTIVWMVHIAIVSGDVKYHLVAYGLSLMIQGMASLLGFGVEQRTMTIS